MDTQRHTIDPNGDTIITLRNPNAPFAVSNKNTDFYVAVSAPKPMGNDQWKAFGGNDHREERPPDSRARVEDGPSVPTKGQSQSVTKVPEAPEIHFRVSSAHLKLASPYFKRALDGPFQESRKAADGLRHVEASDWDTNAFLIVMRIIHGQNRTVSKQIGPEMRAKVAVIVDYYQCLEALDAFVELWRLGLGNYLTPTMSGRDLVMVLVSCWVFGWATEFKKASEQLILRSRKPIDPQGLPIPESILLAIGHERRNMAIEMTKVIDRLLERFRQEPPTCSFDCVSVKLGALERELLHKQELRFYKMVKGDYVGYSIAASMKAMREIRCPNLRESFHRCTCGKPLETEIATLQVPAGLDLKTFIQPTQGYSRDAELVESSIIW